MQTQQRRSEFISVFNQQFQLFLDDVQAVFPDNADIDAARTGVSLLRKANPKLLLVLWKNHVGTPFRVEIDRGDITFFLDRDYQSDVSAASAASADVDGDQIMSIIDRLRGPIRDMGADNQAKAMRHIQNLTKLVFLSGI